MNILKKNIAWLSLAQTTKQIWEFFVGVVLAWILVPEDFGIYAIALIFYSFCQIFSSFGLGNVIIQQQTLSKSFIKTIQSFSFLFGIFFCCNLLLFSSWISWFYEKPQLENILSVLSIFFLLNSLNTIPFAFLAREQKFTTISIIEIFSSIAYGMVALISADMGYGIWSLVHGSAFSVALQVVMLSYSTEYFPFVGWDKTSAKEIFFFGSTLTFSSILNYFSRNLDYLIIGKILGSTHLGVYKRAYDLATLPKDQVSNVITRAFFPALTSIRNDKESVKDLTLLHIKLIAYICYPALIGLSCVAREFILVVYGQKWEMAIIPLKILSIAGVFYTLIALLGAIFVTYQKKMLIIILQVVYFFCLVFSVIIGIQWKLIGVSIGVLLTIFIVALIYLWYVNKIINLSFGNFFNTVKHALLYSIIMCCFVIILGNNLLGSFSLKSILLGKICIGITIYLIMLSFSRDSDILRIRNQIQKKLQSFLRNIFSSKSLP